MGVWKITVTSLLHAAGMLSESEGCQSGVADETAAEDLPCHLMLLRREVVVSCNLLNNLGLHA